MDPSKITFSKEISLMMFGFGDSHKPNPETVSLIESIVLNQLQMLIQEAHKYSDGKSLKGREFVFLMRHNKQKMQRFVRHLKNMELKALLKSKEPSQPIEIDLDPKPRHELFQFIQEIDETGELTDTSQVDEVKVERMMRADRISQALDEHKYLEWSKARGVSFNSRDISHRMDDALRLWVNPSKDINIHKNAIFMLSYLAYQMVADIVDYALLVRMDSKCGTHPWNHLHGADYNNSAMFNGKLNAVKMDYSCNQPPITVAEVKEAMRRIYSGHVGALTFSGDLPVTKHIFVL